MKRILHRNPLTQFYLNRIYWNGIIAATFADLDEINRQIRKDNILRRVA